MPLSDIKKLMNASAKKQQQYLISAYIPRLAPADGTLPPPDKDGGPGWKPVHIDLYDGENKPTWFEHPTWGEKADVVALKLPLENDMLLEGYEVRSDWSPELAPPGKVRIVGLPFGLSGTGKFAIWITGTVASEPSLDFDDLPLFLVDARTRTGQSGSPVITMHKKKAIFLGIYSGRINSESDLGMVWKAKLVGELADYAKSACSATHGNSDA